MSVALLIIIALVVIVGGYFISTQRSLVNLDELCKNALSQIEVQLNSRFDAVIALAKTAAQYAKHESETIIQAVQARGANMGNGNLPATPESINQQTDLLGQMMGRLNVVFERYPELKASDLYREAQEGMKQYEENVRMSRMIYNDTATKMNRVGSGDRPLTHNFSTNMRQAIRIDHQTAKFNASSSSCFLRF